MNNSMTLKVDKPHFFQDHTCLFQRKRSLIFQIDCCMLSVYLYLADGAKICGG